VIKAAVHVTGSDIMVDLEGSSPQVDWGGNVVFNFTYAYVFMAMKSMFDPDIPNNDGCTAPISHEGAPGKRGELQISRRPWRPACRSAIS
jgi:N-methylhydantoinase B